MSQELVEITAVGEVFPAKGAPERPPFEHQQEAMTALDKMDNAYNAYSTMVVLPTGAGKPTRHQSGFCVAHSIGKSKFFG